MKKYMKKSLSLLFASACALYSCSGSNSNTDNSQMEGTDPKPVSEEGIKTIHLDSISVTWIQDDTGEKRMPCSLFPEAPDSTIERLALQEGIPSSISTFLVETGNGIQILFDTGIGGGEGQLSNRLEKLGIAPSDIRYLYLTHFHGDHIGGMLQGDSLVFPNAEIYASKVEYDAWMDMPADRNAQVVKTMNLYKDRLHLFEFGDILPGQVKAIDASGHTPGHTNFQIGRLLIIGDLMHGAALQSLYPEYNSEYDQDKEKAAESRRNILKYARDNRLVMAGMHLPGPAFMPEE